MRNDIKLPHQSNLGVVSSTVQGPLYEVLTRSAYLKIRYPLQKFSDIHSLAENAPADIHSCGRCWCGYGPFRGHCRPRAAVPPEPIPETALRPLSPSISSSLEERSILSGRPVSLACAATGTGHTLGDFDAAILHELCSAGEEGLAERVLVQLTDSKRSIQKDGKPVTDDTLRREMVEQACAVFLTEGIPRLCRLGIIEPKPS